MTRVVSVGNAVVDLLLELPELPRSGADVTATSSRTAVGGSATTLVAARRQGAAAAYAGGHGTGPFGDLVRSALGAEGIAVLADPIRDRDTGWDVAIVEPGGERSFLTTVGAEALGDPHGLVLGAGDLLHVSGYALAREPSGPEIAAWIGSVPREVVVLVDPGPLASTLPREVLAPVVARADWWSANTAEADAIPAGGFRVLIRRGAGGCTVDGVTVPGFAVDAVDTNGAGDVHVGVFLAGLGAGLDAVDAARRANAAAAIAVTRRGPAGAPTRAELDAFLAERGP
ncbi:sugar kinase [Pseudolysinimonas kribbensis]|uniref:Sugar kinase n=1 Tax=Pseudolysinimonas kribbensis TaxID=433641 RepID=A0ABQ6K5B1_9MICO|nr:PfkB family carbohydrate kinase [Pseudolysinimonas kribbensis]GMA95802.1 sugar kinase [Pseudolysinimonas kribbensis]